MWELEKIYVLYHEFLDFLQQPLVQQHLYNPNPNQGIFLTPERIHLKVYLRHFRKARQDFLLRKYFAKWCDFVFRRRHLKQIQARFLLAFL